MEKARKLVKEIPEKYLDKMAKFLDTLSLKEEAFYIV